MVGSVQWGPPDHFPPCHPMPFDSANGGLKCVSMTWRASAWQILLITRHVMGCRLTKTTRVQICVDEVAGNVWQALPL